MFDEEPGVETVTEGMYTRAFLFTSSCSLTALVLLTVGFMGVLYFPVETTEFAMMSIPMAFGVYLWAMSSAISHRGICHRVWSVTDDIPWTMEDVDTEEFVDGPIEVEVYE